MRAQRHKKMLFPNACIFPTRDEAAKRSNNDPQHAIQHDVGWNCLIVYRFVLLITWIFDQAHRQLMSLGTGASKGWWRPRANTRHSKEVSWQPCRREAALQAATNQHRHWRSFSRETYLPRSLPWTTSYKAWKGWALNSCYYSWARRQNFFCFQLHVNEAKGSIQ